MIADSNRGIRWETVMRRNRLKSLVLGLALPVRRRQVAGGFRSVIISRLPPEGE